VSGPVPVQAVPVLLAGDRLVLNRLLAADLAAADPDGVWDVRELELVWPHEPFSAVGEVDEASGTEEQMIEALAGAKVCLTQMAPLTETVLDACPDLELFAISRGGPVNANLQAATEHGVTVTFAPGRNAVATAEYAVGMMLAAMRRIPQSHAGVAAGRWEGDLYAYDATGLELDGTTVGLVGAGAIGSRVTRICRRSVPTSSCTTPTPTRPCCRECDWSSWTSCWRPRGWCRCTPGSPTRPAG
jgi:D-3-phosphoglycerate dehydrogenase / 2-oxoglutarate reductase